MIQITHAQARKLQKYDRLVDRVSEIERVAGELLAQAEKIKGADVLSGPVHRLRELVAEIHSELE